MELINGKTILFAAHVAAILYFHSVPAYIFFFAMYILNCLLLDIYKATHKKVIFGVK